MKHQAKQEDIIYIHYLSIDELEQNTTSICQHDLILLDNAKGIREFRDGYHMSKLINTIGPFGFVGITQDEDGERYPAAFIRASVLDFEDCGNLIPNGVPWAISLTTNTSYRFNTKATLTFVTNGNDSNLQLIKENRKTLSEQAGKVVVFGTFNEQPASNKQTVYFNKKEESDTAPYAVPF